MPIVSNFVPILLLSVAPSITFVSVFAAKISIPLYTGIWATTLEVVFCFISSKRRLGVIPT